MLDDYIEFVISPLDRIASFTVAFEAVENTIKNTMFNVMCIGQ